jgi:hypothetical protein
LNQVAGYSDAEPRHVEQDLSHRLDIAQTLAICRSSRLTIAQLHAICRSSPFNGIRNIAGGTNDEEKEREDRNKK